MKFISLVLIACLCYTGVHRCVAETSFFGVLPTTDFSEPFLRSMKCVEDVLDIQTKKHNVKHLWNGPKEKIDDSIQEYERCGNLDCNLGQADVFVDELNDFYQALKGESKKVYRVITLEVRRICSDA